MGPSKAFPLRLVEAVIRNHFLSGPTPYLIEVTEGDDWNAAEEYSTGLDSHDGVEPLIDPAQVADTHHRSSKYILLFYTS